VSLPGRHRARHRPGFTLLEVMVALVLLSGALMAATDLAGAALRNHEQARDLNAAVLLARGRLAQLEEQYEDQGFKDGDESDQGDFSAEGWPEFRWRLEVLRPAPSLTADQVVGMLTGATGAADAKELAQKLLGGASASGGGASPSPAGSPSSSITSSVCSLRLVKSKSRPLGGSSTRRHAEANCPLSVTGSW